MTSQIRLRSTDSSTRQLAAALEIHTSLRPRTWSDAQDAAASPRTVSSAPPTGLEGRARWATHRALPGSAQHAAVFCIDEKRRPRRSIGRNRPAAVAAATRTTSVRTAQCSSTPPSNGDRRSLMQTRSCTRVRPLSGLMSTPAENLTEPIKQTTMRSLRTFDSACMVC